MKGRLLRFDGNVLTITDARGSKSYEVKDQGYGCYLLTKGDGEKYSSTRSACNCKGYKRWKKCKHSDALRKLGLLDRI